MAKVAHKYSRPNHKFYCPSSMEGLEEWEALDIDDSDIIKLPEARASHAPSPSLTQQKQTCSNILPSKRPSDSQIRQPTVGILNRFKKQNTNSQTLSIPSDLPSLEPCSISSPPHNNNGIHNRAHEATRGSNPRERVQSQPGLRKPPRESQKEPRVPDVAEKITRHIIPGPAGAVQRALHRKPGGDGKGIADEARGPQNVRCSAIEQGEDDPDFQEGPWLCAIEYMQTQTAGCSGKNDFCFCISEHSCVLGLLSNFDEYSYTGAFFNFNKYTHEHFLISTNINTHEQALFIAKN